jgi:alpha-tubulin suppressor-like RCC1 family protein/ferredoxin
MSVSAGGYHTVALRTDGTVRAWNQFSQTDVPSDLGACVAVSAGTYHTVALRTDGTVRAWGGNQYGQTDVPSDLGACMSVSANYYHTVAIRSVDCNANGTPDWREIAAGTQGDCDGDGELDACEIAAGAADVDHNGVPDSCMPPDSDNDGIPDARDNCPHSANADQNDCDNDDIGDSCDQSAVVAWSDLTSSGPDVVHGTIQTSTGPVGVTITGPTAFVQTDGGANYWVPDAAYVSASVPSAPPAADIVALLGGGTQIEIEFSQSVESPVLAVVSLNTPYVFSVPFEVLSSGPGPWGNGPFWAAGNNTLEGSEGNGTIRFPGRHRRIRIDLPTAESWSGFTIGIPLSVVDHDHDGLYDCTDPDDDNDGRADTVDELPLDPTEWADADRDGIGDNADPDDDNDDTADAADGCPFDPLKAAPGVCGCGYPETDSDGDGAPDCVDGCRLDPFETAPGICGCGIPDLDLDGDGIVDCPRPAGVLRLWGWGGITPPPDLGLVRAVSVGVDWAMALRVDGTVRAWSYFNHPQLVPPEDLGPVTAIAAGASHGLALRADGIVRVWGANDWGQTDMPVDVGPAIAVAGGYTHSLVLRTDGTVRAWGLNEWGQTDVPSDLGACSAIAAGQTISVALRTDGTVRAWGNLAGNQPVPSDLGPVSRIDTMAYSQQVVAIRQDGTVRAWGSNGVGQASVPSDLGACVSASAGYTHSLAILPTGAVRAWGYDSGYGSLDVPADLRDPFAVAAGIYVSFAIESTDCNLNGMPDWREMPVTDVDHDGIVDRCVGGTVDCPADVDGDGTIGGADLSLLLASWGKNFAAADLDGDGIVGGSDLGTLLGAWGACK